MLRFLLSTTLIMVALATTAAFAAFTNFSNDQIVFPKGRAEIAKFLDLLKDTKNANVVGLPFESPVYEDILQESSSKFTIGGQTFMLYNDDLNNDGKPEYVLIYLNAEADNNSGVQGAYELKDGHLKSLNFDKIVVKNLFPKDDMSKFWSYLARPFAVNVKGKRYMRFATDKSAKQVHTYLWQNESFKEEDPKKPKH